MPIAYRVLSVALLAISFSPNIGISADFVELRGETMGTTYSVKFPVGEGGDPTQLKRAIDQRLKEINQHMSTYIEDSELSRFNRAPADEWFDVSEDTASVVELAVRISEQTNGAFDVTVGPLVQLWGFGSQRSDPTTFQPPSDKAIRQTLERVGFHKLHVRHDPPALRKDVAGLTVDLSAIAKGYGVDEVLRLTREHGVTRAMVEIGGEVRVVGGRTEAEPWRIGVESPISETRELALILPIRDTSVATSGDYRNYFQWQGKRFSHTIDPTTGDVARHTLGSATILRPTCAEADAIATAMMVMGPSKGTQWLNDHQIAGVLLNRTSSGFEEIRSISFARNETAEVPSALAPREDAKAEESFVTVVLLAGLVFGVALGGMAIGVLISNRRIQGSCGGMANLKDEHGEIACSMCSDPAPECRELIAQAAKNREGLVQDDES